MSPQTRWALGAILLVPMLALADNSPTALDNYVHTPDPTFSYNLMGVKSGVAGTNTTIYTYLMTSQTWQDSTKTDTPVWQHKVELIVPARVTAHTGTLWIDGGSNPPDFSPPDPNDSKTDIVERALSVTASRTGSVITILTQVPNEPIIFNSDPGRPRSEDSAIAQSLLDYVNSGGSAETSPLLIPMVKAATSAMDLTQKVVKNLPQPASVNLSSQSSFSLSSTASPDISINDFVVAGASKRGWTTWLTGATDSRVKAIMPIVFDALNLPEQLPEYGKIYDKVPMDPDPSKTTVTSDGYHQYPAALDPYVRLTPDGSVSLTRIYSNPELYPPEVVATAHQAVNLIDPYAYKDRYAEMPKYSVNASGDEFFANVSSNNWFHDMPGPKWVRYIPNASHGIIIDLRPDNPANLDDNPDNDDVNLMATDTFIESYNAYYTSLLTGEQLPTYDWTITPSIDGLGVTISVQFGSVLPDHFRVWYADNTESPDFRFNGGQNPAAIWHMLDISTLDPSAWVNGLFSYTMALPTVGYREFYLDFDYQLRDAKAYKWDILELGNAAVARKPYFTFSSGIALMDTKGIFPGATGDALELAKLSSAAVPEASTILMTSIGLASLGWFASRRRRSA